MQKTTVPEELLSLREQIDTLDEELLAVLVKRFEVTARVGKLKASNDLESVDEEREALKLNHLKQEALEHELNPDLVLALFKMIFAEVVRNHKNYRK